MNPTPFGIFPTIPEFQMPPMPDTTNGCLSNSESNNHSNETTNSKYSNSSDNSNDDNLLIKPKRENLSSPTLAGLNTLNNINNINNNLSNSIQSLNNPFSSKINNNIIINNKFHPHSIKSKKKLKKNKSKNNILPQPSYLFPSNNMLMPSQIPNSNFSSFDGTFPSVITPINNNNDNDSKKLPQWNFTLLPPPYMMDPPFTMESSMFKMGNNTFNNTNNIIINNNDTNNSDNEKILIKKRKKSKKKKNKHKIKKKRGKKRLHSDIDNITNDIDINTHNNNNNNNNNKKHKKSINQQTTKRKKMNRNIKGGKGAIYRMIIEEPANKKMLSCHQCKNKKTLSRIIVCGHVFKLKNTIKNCTKKYCKSCLLRFYLESPPNDPSDPSWSQWKCPCCRYLCCCAWCRKKKSKVVQSVEKQIAIQSHKLTPAISLARKLVMESRSNDKTILKKNNKKKYETKSFTPTIVS